MTNTTGTPQPYVEGMSQNNMNNHNMNNLHNSNNTEMDTDLSMMNNTHSNQVMYVRNVHVSVYVSAGDSHVHRRAFNSCVGLSVCSRRCVELYTFLT